MVYYNVDHEIPPPYRMKVPSFLSAILYQSPAAIETT